MQGKRREFRRKRNDKIKIANIKISIGLYIEEKVKINTIAPIKKKKVKNNSQDWFDGEVAEKIAIRDKLFKKFKKSKLHVDKDLFREARNNVENLIKSKKKTYFEDKLKENIGKPKELWKALNDLGFT